MIGQKFTFTEAGWKEDRQEAFFRYQIITDERVFDLEEKIILPLPVPESTESEKLVRALHLALGISYYKAFFPPEMEHPYKMTAVESDFWNTIYKNGLGEFIYTNKLSSETLAKFSAQEGLETEVESETFWNNSAILGIGGGKDSIVAGEILKEIGVEIKGFVLATGDNTGLTKQVSDVMGVDLLVISRIIDQQIIEINNIPGSYNGHIPISVIFALAGALLSTATGNRYIVVANEASSSIPQTEWEGQNINHQWSKSIDFERLFQDYLRAYITPELHYFSAVRPLSSVAVAKIFAGYPSYFEVFTSDNSHFKIHQKERTHPRWNPESTKSLSSYILLAPWLSEEDLLRTFGQNYLDNSDLEHMCSSLLGENGQVVLDCVGTPEELKASLNELIRQNRFSDSKILNYTKHKQLLDDAKPITSYTGIGNHAIPSEIEAKLIQVMENKL